MAKSATILTLNQLADASLIGPELGTVHFRLLHTCIQIMISQLGLKDLKVEFKGSESDLIQKMYDPKTKKGGINATHYKIHSGVGGVGATGSTGASQDTTQSSVHESANIDGGEESVREILKFFTTLLPEFIKLVNSIKKLDEEAEENEKELKIIERRKQSNEDPDENPNQFSSPPHYKLLPGDVVIMPTNERNEVTPGFTVAVTTEDFQRLTDDVEELKQKYTELTAISSNSDLVKAVKNGSISEDGTPGPLVDMYKIITLAKRVEAAEIGMTKLASMIEDLARGQDENGAISVDTREKLQAASRSIKSSIMSAQKPPEKGGGLAGKSGGSAGKGGGLSESLSENRSEFSEKGRAFTDKLTEFEGQDLETVLEQIVQRLAVLENLKAGGRKKRSVEEGGSPKTREAPGIIVKEDFSKVDLVQLDIDSALGMIQQEFRNVRNLIQALDVPGLQGRMEQAGLVEEGLPGTFRSAAGGGDITERMSLMEQRFQECVAQINSLDTAFHSRIENVVEQVTHVERELGNVAEKMHITSDFNVSATSGSQELYRRFAELEKVTNNIAQTMAELLDERQDRQLHMSSIREQIELLKTIKADKQDVDNQLADKVDVSVINRKVSHEQFDATCTDLTRGIESALEKLTKQEQLWQTALSEMQSEVGTKLDKGELTMLREFMKQKLALLQTKLKALSKMKADQEAAATKQALLTDVKCISCDREAVMRKKVDPSLYPQQPALPPTRTMAPFLAYELDQLRKQQRTALNSKNMIHFEAIKKGNVCTRYCGGSHTVTTPQQRVTRMGNFLEQWGPEVTTVHESEIKGKDGMVYRGEEETNQQSDSEARISEDERSGPRQSITVQGDILSNRPNFETPVKLELSQKNRGVKFGGE